jgi:hypothetical protein
VDVAHSAETTEAPPVAPARTGAERAFNMSLVVSGIRCTLTYVILPFVAPLIGLAPGVGPVLGIAIGIVAIWANVASIRRFWKVQHPRRRLVTVIHSLVIAFLLVLIVNDLRSLL